MNLAEVLSSDVIVSKIKVLGIGVKIEIKERYNESFAVWIIWNEECNV